MSYTCRADDATGRYWHELSASGGEITLADVNPASWKHITTAQKGLNFPTGVDTRASAHLILPPHWKEGSDVYAFFRYFLGDTGAGNMSTFMYQNWMNADDVYPGATTLDNDLFAASGTANQYTFRWFDNKSGNNHIIDGAGKTIGSLLELEFYREGTSGSDTYGDSLYLVSMGVMIECDSRGQSTLDGK